MDKKTLKKANEIEKTIEFYENSIIELGTLIKNISESESITICTEVLKSSAFINLNSAHRLLFKKRIKDCLNEIICDYMQAKENLIKEFTEL